MSDRKILITGGSGKFGLKFIEFFLKNNDTVIFTARSEKSRDSVLNRFSEYSNKIVGFVHDFILTDSISDLLSKLIERQLLPNVLINNARSLESLKINRDGIVEREDFVNEYIVDVVAPYELTIKLANVKGSLLNVVVNIGSQYGVVAANPHLYDNPSQESPIHYGVAKAALGHLTKELAVRLADKKIQINCVAFGGVEGRVDEKFKQRYANLTPMKRMLTEDEIIGPVNFLLSASSSGMTGQTIQVDGGWSLW